jgi:hypothetical protein
MPSCSYACVADPTTANSTCSGPIVSQMMGSGQAVFQVDLTGFSQLYLALTICDPTDWVLNIGNSPSNNGAGGDAAQFSNDSELQIQNTTFAVYGNQNASTPLLLTDPAFIPGAGCVNRGIIVGDSLVETLSPPHTVTSPYVFRINQPDTEGQPDALFYVGLNRVVSIGSPRTGSGVSLASFCLK